MKHEVKFYPGHDCINFECIHDSPTCAPGKGGSHGVHGLTIGFYVIGDKGAVQFTLGTSWLPFFCEPSEIGSRHVPRDYERHSVMPYDLGYHAREPMYEGQSIMTEHCEMLGGDPCYYDGSGLNATDAFYTLVNAGEDALWEFLEQYYRCTFEDAEYPEPQEYKKPRREEAPCSANDSD